jgi:hypothetical protein
MIEPDTTNEAVLNAFWLGEGDYTHDVVLDELVRQCDCSDACGDRGNQHEIRRLVAAVRELKQKLKKLNKHSQT